jgi:hypothetical protein
LDNGLLVSKKTLCLFAREEIKIRFSDDVTWVGHTQSGHMGAIGD